MINSNPHPVINSMINLAATLMINSVRLFRPTMITSVVPMAGQGRVRRRRDERGMAPSVELIILVPALMIILGMIIGGGRIWFTRAAISEAAYSGARAASLERSTDRAWSSGRQATVQQLRTDGVRCADRAIDLDVSALDAELGRPAAVTNTVHCRVGFGDLVLPGLPGSLRLAGSSSAVVDTYRER